MDFSKLKRFADLTERLKEIELEEKAIKAELEALEPQIIEGMADAGLSHANINNRTYYINRSLFAGAAAGFTKFDVIGALKNADMSDYVSETYNSQSLSAFVRSIAKEDDAALAPDEIKKRLPAPLQGVLYIGEKFNLRSRKG